MSSQLLSLPKVAEQTETSVAFWRKLVYRREIPCVRLGRLVRLRQEDVEAYVRLGLRPSRQGRA